MEKTETQKFVEAVVKGKNVKASKNLELILKKKCAKKIADALRS